MRVEEAYRNAMTTATASRRRARNWRWARGTELTKIPQILAQQLAFPYTQGRVFVNALLHAGGQPRVDRAFREPPTTTEQVLHPEKFFAGEGPKRIADPTPDKASTSKGVVGELILRLLMATAVRADEAMAAAAGWGGDRYVSWTEGDVTCVRAAFVMDSAADAEDLRDALTKWAARQKRATVSVGDPLVLTSCG